MTMSSIVLFLSLAIWEVGPVVEAPSALPVLAPGAAPVVAVVEPVAPAVVVAAGFWSLLSVVAAGLAPNKLEAAVVVGAAAPEVVVAPDAAG